jgi:hypothetical protein
VIRIVTLAVIAGALYLALLAEVQRLDDMAVDRLDQLHAQRTNQ